MQSCRMPDVVEVWDVTAQDPRLLVFLKVGIISTRIIMLCCSISLLTGVGMLLQMNGAEL